MDYSAYVGLDVHKTTIAIAIAEAGRGSEVRFFGEIANSPYALAPLLKKLGARHGKLYFVHEAGPCGYGLYRQIIEAGHVCDVVSPAHTPRRAGDRIKTDRRDAIMLARLSRAGELTKVWTPDYAHETMRDLIRAREVASKDVRQARQRVQGFLLRNGRDMPARFGSAAIAFGLATRASTIRRSRSLSRPISTPWIRPSRESQRWRSKSRLCCQTGRSDRSSRRCRPSAASRSPLRPAWSLKSATSGALTILASSWPTSAWSPKSAPAAKHGGRRASPKPAASSRAN
jgi:hypothetical protein